MRRPSELFRFACIASSLLLSLLPSALAQTIINVPADQKTIQAGIDAANNGDTVLVAPGMYFENIDFQGKLITVTSSAGAATTILDGGSIAPAVTFQSGETRSSILSGFTIQHGGVQSYDISVANGGIYVDAASPTIINNTLTHNNCYSIYSEGAPLIQNNEIDNTLDKSPTGYPDCSFGGGSAILLWEDLVYETGNTDLPTVLGNLLQNNTQSGFEDAGGNGGAGVANWTGLSVAIENNIIRNNISGGQGTAIHLQAGAGLIVGNLVYGNQSGGGGGGLDVDGGFPDPAEPAYPALIANNTFVDNVYNQAYSDGESNDAPVDQLYFGSYGFIGPSIAFVNNIVAGNSPNVAVECGWYQLASPQTDTIIFDHNLVYNSGGPVFDLNLCADPVGTYGNLSADPKFVDASTANYTLAPGSPAIDSGNNSVVAYLAQNGIDYTTDISGNPRLQDATGLG